MGGGCCKLKEPIKIHPQLSLDQNIDRLSNRATNGVIRQQLPYQSFQDDSISPSLSLFPVEFKKQSKQKTNSHFLETEQELCTPDGFHPVCISSQSRDKCFRLFNNLQPNPEECFQRNFIKSILQSWNENGLLLDIERYVSHVSSSNCSVEEIAIILTGESADYLSTLCNHLHKQLAKLYAIYNWVATNIKYDVLAWDNLIAGERPPDVSSEYVMDHRVTICSGYSNIFKAIALEADLEVNVVEGHFRSSLCDQKTKHPQFFSPNKANTHSWNAVRLDGVWHLLDCTYASGVVNRGSFIPKFTSEYFVVPPEQMIFTHWPDYPIWQLLEFPVNLQELQTLVVLSPSFFNLGIQLGDLQELLKIPPHSDDPVIKVTLNISLNSQVVCVLNDCPEDSSASATTKRKYDKYVFYEYGIDGKVCLYIIIPDQGLYTLKLYTKHFCESSFNFCCSYLVSCETDSDRYLGFPEINANAAQKYDFQLLYWNDMCNSNCTKSHVAECRSGELILYFKADTATKFIHFITSGRFRSVDSNSQFHYYTSLTRDFKNQSLWKLHVIFPSIGLWTVCISTNSTSNEKSDLLVMSYEVNVISLKGHIGWYPWIQSNTVKLVRNDPIKETGKEVIKIPFCTNEILEFRSLLINTSAILIEYDQYTMITKSSINKYELKIVLPQPGKWIAQVLSCPSSEKGVEFSNLFSCYFDVDECMPNTSFAIFNKDVTTKYEIKLLDGILLYCNVEHFVTRLKAPGSAHFHAELRYGWSNEIERTSPKYSHCAFTAPEGNDIHRVEVMFPDSGEWNLVISALFDQSLSHELVICQMKFTTTIHQSNMLFPRLYPSFYSFHMSIPCEYIPYKCNIENKASFLLSVAEQIRIFPVIFKSDEPDKEYYNQAVIVPQGWSSDVYQLEAVFPDIGEWIIQIFGADRESTKDIQLVLQLFYAVSKATTGLVYPQLRTSFFTKYHMAILKPSLLLPSFLQGTPNQISFKFHKPEFTQVVHEARNNGTLIKGATQLVPIDDPEQYNFLTHLSSTGVWEIQIFAKHSWPLNSAKCHWELVFTHTLHITPVHSTF